MKKFFLFFAISGVLFLFACSDNATNNEHEGHDMAGKTSDTIKMVASTDEDTIKEVAAIFSAIDPQAASSVKAIVDHYLDVKNALVADNPKGAAKEANGMINVLKAFDKSLLTADQKKSYDAVESNLNKHAEHISKNANNIMVQRLQFADLSQAIYELVKAFGAGRIVYHDHCPMARDNQGAMWISELKDVKNPYFGAEMLTCGTVEEIVK